MCHVTSVGDLLSTHGDWVIKWETLDGMHCERLLDSVAEVSISKIEKIWGIWDLKLNLLVKRIISLL